MYSLCYLWVVTCIISFPFFSIFISWQNNSETAEVFYIIGNFPFSSFSHYKYTDHFVFLQPTTGININFIFSNWISFTFEMSSEMSDLKGITIVSERDSIHTARSGWRSFAITSWVTIMRGFSEDFLLLARTSYYQHL